MGGLRQYIWWPRSQASHNSICSASPFLLHSLQRAFSTDLLQATDWSSVLRCTKTWERFVQAKRLSSHLSRHVFCLTGSSSEELLLSSFLSSPFVSSLCLVFASSSLTSAVSTSFFFFSFFGFSEAFIISLNSLTAAAAASFCFCRFVSSSSPRGGFRYFRSMPCSTCQIEYDKVRLQKKFCLTRKLTDSKVFWSPHVSGYLPTYPSPKPTLRLTSHLGKNVGLGKGKVDRYPETCNDSVFFYPGPTIELLDLWNANFGFGISRLTSFFPSQVG